ncbi:hypothetical protein ACVDG8_034210 [Mesorhizobium sp. ORM8.1]
MTVRIVGGNLRDLSCMPLTDNGKTGTEIDCQLDDWTPPPLALYALQGPAYLVEIDRNPERRSALHRFALASGSLGAGAPIGAKGKLAALIGRPHSPTRGIPKKLTTLGGRHQAAVTYDGGSEMVAGDRYIPRPTIEDAFFCYRRHATQSRDFPVFGQP